MSLDDRSGILIIEAPAAAPVVPARISCVRTML
jgi:hypothetical protein